MNEAIQLFHFLYDTNTVALSIDGFDIDLKR